MWIPKCLVVMLVVCCACSGARSRETTPAGAEGSTPAPTRKDQEGEATPAATSKLGASIATIFDDAAERGAFTGTVLVAEAGVVSWTKSYGMADRALSTPNTTESIYRVGSLTKSWTAAAILALEDEGKLSTDAPASRFLPRYPAERLRKNGRDVTLLHLLHHVSGIPAMEQTALFRDVWTRPFTKDEWIDALSAQPLESTPGEVFRYSNAGYLLLAAVVEAAAQMPFEQYLRGKIFDPLGMNDTSTRPAPDAMSRVSQGYFLDRGTIRSFAQSNAFGDPDLTFAFGFGNFVSTAPDLWLWHRGLLNGAVLSPPSIRKLFSPGRNDYGCGWVVRTIHGVTVHWHNGALTPLGFTAAVTRVPERDVFVSYLSNLDRSLIADDLDANIMAAVLEK